MRGRQSDGGREEIQEEKRREGKLLNVRKETGRENREWKWKRVMKERKKYRWKNGEEIKRDKIERYTNIRRE